MKKVTNYLKLACACIAFLPGVALAKDPAKLKVLIIDGQNNHDWVSTTPVLVDVLNSSGVFEATVSTSPPKKSKKGAWAKWNPKFSDYDAVLSNYNGEMWPEEVQKNFVKYVKDGGGFIVVHAADNAFGKWKEYNQMIGIGGWGGRVLGRDGVWVHAEDGKEVRDTVSEGKGGGHGARYEFHIDHIQEGHPITKGLPSKWLHTRDELYCKMCGPAENMEVQATARSKKTKRNEPMVLTVKFGKGRVFHTTLGHDTQSMLCRGFYELVQRGTEWAITGEVERTADVPKDFPTADKTSPVEIAK
ncbi:MAG: ThuA domain-containing protein [Akkermansiaceae bacterium]